MVSKHLARAPGDASVGSATSREGAEVASLEFMRATRKLLGVKTPQLVLPSSPSLQPFAHPAALSHKSPHVEPPTRWRNSALNMTQPPKARKC